MIQLLNTDIKKRKGKILVLNIMISLLTFILLLVLGRWIVATISDITHQIDKPLSSLSLNPIDFLILATIPLWTYHFYSRDEKITWNKIFLVYIYAISVLIFTCVLSFVIIDIFIEQHSILIPEYYVLMPFELFPTVVLITGSLLTILLFHLIKKT